MCRHAICIYRLAILNSCKMGPDKTAERRLWAALGVSACLHLLTLAMVLSSRTQTHSGAASLEHGRALLQAPTAAPAAVVRRPAAATPARQ